MNIVERFKARQEQKRKKKEARKALVDKADMLLGCLTEAFKKNPEKWHIDDCYGFMSDYVTVEIARKYKDRSTVRRVEIDHHPSRVRIYLSACLATLMDENGNNVSASREVVKKFEAEVSRVHAARKAERRANAQRYRNEKLDEAIEDYCGCEEEK